MLVPCGTNCFLAEVNKSYDHAGCKFRLILGADEKFCSMVGLQTRQADGHSQVHSGRDEVNPPGASPDQLESQRSVTVAKGPIFTSRTTAVYETASQNKRSRRELKQIMQLLSDAPCAPIFPSKFACINSKLDYCRSIFLAITIAGNYLHSGCSSIVTIDSHCVYIQIQHLIRFSSLLFLFTGPFFILPGMRSIWECRWKAKVFQHPLIEICFIN